MRFTVASLDVLGSEVNGWKVNNQNQVGTVDISQEVFENDQLVLNVLNISGYLENATIDDVYFMCDDNAYLQIHDEETERPILALILEQ